MTRLPPHFIEDRALRNAARAVLAEDLTRLRARLDEQGIASRVSTSVTGRITGRIRAGADDLLATARAQAGDHKGVLALLVGALALFFARAPIMDWLGTLGDDADGDDLAPADSDDPEHPATLEGDPA
jgi:hypothetical protein